MKNIKLRELLSSRLRPIVAGVTGLIAIAVVLSVALPAQAAVGINKTVNFQGKVVNLNGTNVADGSYTFRFRIYTAATGDLSVICGNGCKWEETKTITTVNGIFQTNLGSVTPFGSSVDFNSDTLYVGVQFNGDTEMTPRIRLTAVPYAFNADKLGGLDSSSFAQLSPPVQQTGFLNVSGNITSGGILMVNNIDTASATVLGIGDLSATAINLNQNTSLAFAKSLTFAGGASNFDQSLSTGTFKTGSGAVSINGDTTIAANKTFTANGLTTVRTNSNTAFQVQNSGNYNVLVVDTNSGYVGISTGSNTLSYSLEVNGDTGITGNLYLGYGTNRTIAVANNPGGAGDVLSVRGGNAGTGNNNGGDLNLSGGAGSGTGVQGLVNLSAAVFSASAVQTFIGSPTGPTTVTLSQALIDASNSIPVSASNTNVTMNVPDPTQKVAGRILYVAARSGSQDFTLVLNSGRTPIPIAMRQNSTATLIWNGTDWTAAGASSSTTLQAAYDNTLASAGGAEIILNNSTTSNGLTIRNGTVQPVIGGLFEVQSSIGTNYLSVNNGSKADDLTANEYASNGGAETAFSSSNWSEIGGSIQRNTSDTPYVATGQASAQVNTLAGNATSGIRNRLSTNLPFGNDTTNGYNDPISYQVSFTAKRDAASSALTTLRVYYSTDGSSASVLCTDNKTVATTWTKITCTFTPVSAGTASSILIQQGDTPAAGRTFYVDNLSVTMSTLHTNPPNVQIGGGVYGGTPTLFTLDRSSSPPVAAGNEVYYGSMYYDTTSGRIQCYQANGWGACGSAPDTFVNLSPEYAGAVLNGTGVGTMTADVCSNQSGVLQINAPLCGSGQSLNFYKWTSPQPASPSPMQVYSIYLSYQLPGGFKNFQSNSTVNLTGRIDNTANAEVTYEMFRSQGGAVTQCGTETRVTEDASQNPVANSWITKPINGNEQDGCGFNTSSANNFVIFKINLKARANATAYVSTLNFTVTNQ